MALSPRLIRRRIRSVGNTRKITKAMEMVSAAKMRRAVGRALGSRVYAKLAYEVVERVARTTNPRLHPLLSGKIKPEITEEGEMLTTDQKKKTAVLLVSSNRGLCGGFNSQVAAKALGAIQQTIGPLEVITLGKKGRDVLRRNAISITADFAKSDMTNRLEDVLPLARLLLKEFMEGKYRKVILVYTHFTSALLQKPIVRQLLPLSDELLEKNEQEEFEEESEAYYLFEPSPRELLNVVLPRILELQVYQAVLESEASEHSARMLAMRNATDAAKDMIDGLTLVYNQARQAGITREIAEIAGGKAALEN